MLDRLFTIVLALWCLFTGVPALAQPEGAAAGPTPPAQAGGSVVPVPAPARIGTAEDIVSHYIAALGGREKLQGLNTLYFEGKAILPSGLEITTRTWKVYDRLYRQELNFGEGNIVIIATPNKGWTVNPHTGGEFQPIATEDLKALRVEIDPAGPLADYADKGFKLERGGSDTVAGRPCYVVKVFCPYNHNITYSIDEKTFYVLKEVRRGGGLICSKVTGLWNGKTGDEVVLEYSDYRKAPGGYILPYSVFIKELGAPITVQRVEINKTVDVDALSRPR